MPSDTTIAYLTSLPVSVPPGGRAVILADGRVAGDGVQGPGELLPARWANEGKHLEAIVFPTAVLALRFDVPGLRSAEAVALSLTVTLALRLDNPVRFLTDVVQNVLPFHAADLASRLCDTLRTTLAPALYGRTLRELDADPGLRAWLDAGVAAALREAADLEGRSGLVLVGVEAFDLRCEVWDELQRTRETYFLAASVIQAEAAGRRLLDARLLTELQAHLPLKQEVVGKKEALAGLLEREAAADARVHTAVTRKEAAQRAWQAALTQPPSSLLRPELWRIALDEPTTTAPCLDGSQVYAITHGGHLAAFDAADGAPRWPQPLAVGAKPGDGMVMAAGVLWIPGRDGVLYGVNPTSGLVTQRLSLGGCLSSAPLVVDDHLLYVSLDIDPSMRAGFGHVVEVDARQGVELRRWQLCQYGLRAMPVRYGSLLFVGDRHGSLHMLDLQRQHSEAIPLRSGHLLGAPLIDKARSQVIVGTAYGLAALNLSGQPRWVQRLGSQVVGQPLLLDNRLFAGAADGQVYTLDPVDGKALGPPFVAHGPIATSPAHWDHLIFIGSNDGYLYAMESSTGQLFWQYHSGSPVCVTPAVGAEGRLFVLDSSGHLSALRWCLARYTDAALRCQRSQPPRWAEAAEFWRLAGDVQEAYDAAVKAGRLDLVAALASDLQWYDKAAEAYEKLGRRATGSPARAAAWWARAATAWDLALQPKRADACRCADAEARHAPLLRLHAANQPLFTHGQGGVLQISVSNELDALAMDVRLSYRGDVKQAGEKALGSLGPHGERMVAIEIVPTESGSASVQVTAHYADAQGNAQLPVRLDLPLRVAQPVAIHHHYYGPTAQVGGDGVIILRSGEGDAGRAVEIQAGEDRVRLGKQPSF